MICNKPRLNQFSGSKCEEPWFDVVNTCFRIFSGNISATWDGARYYCLLQGGDLAVVDSERKRTAITTRLTNIDTTHPGFLKRLFIGLRKKDWWQWLGGKDIPSNFWHTGFPISGECVALDKGLHDWKLFTVGCYSHRGFLCETTEREYFLLV